MRCSSRSAALSALSAAMLTGCVPQAAPPPVRQPAPPPATPVVAPPPKPLAADWRDWPVTPGNWRYETVQVIARYSAPDGSTLLTLACDRPAARIILRRPAPSPATALTIRTTSVSRTVPVQSRAPAGASAMVMVEGSLPANDRLLDAMAFSRGSFTVEQAGQPPLVIPAWAEVGRVVQDCRQP